MASLPGASEEQQWTGEPSSSQKVYGPTFEDESFDVSHDAAGTFRITGTSDLLGPRTWPLTGEGC